ncbi:monothiol glutaredoxin-S11-like [Humulus lupulus]|uniref:monothiol glutaredoxin-S11-like n=1 Tax=Humulus lupulus TaxID=3486 RepID=UPI002B40BA60|nr:monothiol glutaredoxin-S11-like [Humulus lupulus]
MAYSKSKIEFVVPFSGCNDTNHAWLFLSTRSSRRLLNDGLKKVVAYSPAMLFMEGTPDAPSCGFSLLGPFDISNEEEVRQGLIKVFTNWTTLSQLYYKGALIDVCDIVLELKNMA